MPVLVPLGYLQMEPGFRMQQTNQLKHNYFDPTSPLMYLPTLAWLFKAVVAVYSAVKMLGVYLYSDYYFPLPLRRRHLPGQRRRDRFWDLKVFWILLHMVLVVCWIPCCCGCVGFFIRHLLLLWSLPGS